MYSLNTFLRKGDKLIMVSLLSMLRNSVSLYMLGLCSEISWDVLFPASVSPYSRSMQKVWPGSGPNRAY